MKKLTAISLLTVIFINQLGCYFYYTYQQYRIRREIKKELLANLPNSELEVFAEEQFKDHLVWEEYGKEFHFNDEMYDVAHIEIKDGKRLFYCINDKKEKKLLDKLVEVVKNSSDEARKQGRGKNVVKFQLSDFEPPVNELPAGLTVISTPQYSRFTASLLTSAIEIKSPPPKAFSL